MRYSMHWSDDILWDPTASSISEVANVANQTVYHINETTPYTKYSLRLSYDEDTLVDDELCEVVTPEIGERFASQMKF